MREMQDATKDMRPLAISAAELARWLGVSLRHVRRLDVSGRLPRPVRLGRAVRWSVAELISWLAAGAPARQAWEQVKSRTN